jgi:mitochondrial fission protein ELM1
MRRHDNKVFALLLRLPYRFARLNPKRFGGVVFGENDSVPFLNIAAYRNALTAQAHIKRTFNGRVKVIHINVQYPPLHCRYLTFENLFKLPIDNCVIPIYNGNQKLNTIAIIHQLRKFVNS